MSYLFCNDIHSMVLREIKDKSQTLLDAQTSIFETSPSSEDLNLYDKSNIPLDHNIYFTGNDGILYYNSLLETSKYDISVYTRQTNPEYTQLDMNRFMNNIYAVCDITASRLTKHIKENQTEAVLVTTPIGEPRRTIARAVKRYNGICS